MLGSRKKLISQITTFLTQPQAFYSSQVGGVQFNKVGFSKEQAKFEKEDVEEVKDER